MADTRKKLTFKIPAASVDDFEAAKRQAERELGIAMTANEFAKRVVVQAVRGANAGEQIIGTVTRTWHAEDGERMAEVLMGGAK